jgi:hypothetical protein
MKVIWVLIVILSLVVISGLLFLSFPSKRFQKVLSEKPRLSGEIIKNPDFIYSGEGWFSDEDPTSPFIFLKRDKIDWKSNGRYLNGTFQERTGLVILHPVNKTKGRYVEQTVFLPSRKKHYLVFGLQNAANYISPTDCSDNIFKVSIIDETKKEEKVIFYESINANDGWKDFCVDISDFAGKNVTVKLEGLAGGPCGDWKGEWGEVDYIDILSEC